MGSKKGDEHLHHLVCEICQKEFDDVHELSKYVIKITYAILTYGTIKWADIRPSCQIINILNVSRL
jgi:phage host-nuclease inhibitor protein Gam